MFVTKYQAPESKLLNCPFCGMHHPLSIERAIAGFYIYCSDSDTGCGAETGIYSTIEEAIEVWNNLPGRKGDSK